LNTKDILPIIGTKKINPKGAKVLTLFDIDNTILDNTKDILSITRTTS
jgi:hypothetical protein